MSHFLDRTEMLIGKEKIQKLQHATVAVFGIGGVGSYAAEALVRSGIGNLVIIDHDKVDVTNINRQLIADTTTIGLPKVLVAKERYLKINPNLHITVFEKFFNEETLPELMEISYDYIIDAIDSVSSKLLLIETAYQKKIPIISCMGTGNKLNPSLFEVSDISHTEVCPLAKIIRKELKKKGISDLKVVYSKEKPYKMDTGSSCPASISFVPSVAGLLMASEVIQDFF